MNLLVYIGSLHQIQVKFQETGTQEMMLVQEPNKYLDAPDGLYLVVDNSRTQDIPVEIFGILIAVRIIGVIPLLSPARISSDSNFRTLLLYIRLVFA